MSATYTEYKVLWGNTVQEVERKVNNLLSEGWEPIGPALAGSEKPGTAKKWYQTLVKRAH